MSERDNHREKLLRIFKGNYSEMDLSDIVTFFSDDKKEGELRCLLSGHFDEFMSGDEDETRNLDHILHKIHFNINSQSPVRSISLIDKICRWSLRIAGILVLPVLIFLGLQTHKQHTEARESWIEIKAPAWTRIQFSLPDGTTGWLNSNSTLRYDGIFISDRKVELSGEAFFDVSPDKKRPFKVDAGEIIVTVLGTRFNLASYDDEGDVEVVLDEGKLLVNGRDTNKTYEMNPNELVRYNKTNGEFISEIIQPQKYISWKEGKLVFRNDPLDIVARRLERWYNIDVEIKGNISQDLRLRATFVEESLDEVLYLLKCSLPLTYTIEERGISGDQTYAKKKVIITL